MKNASKLEWKPVPDSPGDWLWIILWSCKCCVFDSGIAYVRSLADHTPEELVDQSWEFLPGKLGLGWEGSNPRGTSKIIRKHEMDDITAWAKIVMPAHDTLDDGILSGHMGCKLIVKEE